MSWINVEEQFPETEEDVLAYSTVNGCYRAWYDCGTWLSHETSIKSDPTHWMPMPKTPLVAASNGSASYGMTDNFVTSDTRPYAVWSENVDTAKDIKQAWETRFGGSYKIFKNNEGYQVKYMGEWLDTPSIQ